jgi:UDP-glucose 4-epimerase
MAFTSHILGMDNPLLDVHANLVSHVYLLNALKGAGTKRVIYIGSRGQYGRVKADRITEDTPCSPIDIQGVNKAAAECLLKIYSRVFGFEAVSLRVTNCFGERQKVRGDDIGLVGSFIRDALAGRTIEVYGDGARKKNILYVKDLARIIAIIAQRSIGGFEAFNVAGHELAITALLDAIIKICRKGKYLIAPFPGGIERIDTGDARFSDHKLRGVIGKTRLIEVRIALGNTVRYFRETADA